MAGRLHLTTRSSSTFEPSRRSAIRRPGPGSNRRARPAIRVPASRRGCTTRSGCWAGSGSSASSKARMPARRSPCAWSRDTVPVDRWARAAIWPTASRLGAHGSPRAAGRGANAECGRCSGPGLRAPGRGGSRAARGARRRRTRGRRRIPAGAARQLPARPRSARPSRRRSAPLWTRSGCGWSGCSVAAPMVDGESACARFEEAGGGLPAWLVPDDAADERGADRDVHGLGALVPRRGVAARRAVRCPGSVSGWSTGSRSGPAPPCWPRRPTVAARSTGTASTPRRPGS